MVSRRIEMKNWQIAYLESVKRCYEAEKEHDRIFKEMKMVKINHPIKSDGTFKRLLARLGIC